MRFRRIQNGDRLNTAFRLSPTDLGKCPFIIEKKKKGTRDKEITDQLQEIFNIGNEAHQLEGIYRYGMRGLCETEYRLQIYAPEEHVIFTGYIDFIMVDNKGLYIEDLKTANRNAFYFFNKDAENYYERIQVSGYRFLYYIIHGVDIPRAVITKIDRDNFRNRMSLEIEPHKPELTERIILTHPTFLYMKGDIDTKQFYKMTEVFIRESRWLCNYCEEKKECAINKKLTLEEKKEKEKKKKAKAQFKSLLEEA
jgi:hypothetical protein